MRDWLSEQDLGFSERLRGGSGQAPESDRNRSPQGNGRPGIGSVRSTDAIAAPRTRGFDDAGSSHGAGTSAGTALAEHPARSISAEVIASRRTAPRPSRARSSEDVAPGGVNVSIEPAGVLPILSRELPAWKRAFDVVFASLALVLVLPVLPVIALAVKLTSKGPLLFVQQRTGMNLKRFGMLKFRTMRIDADELREQLRHSNEMSGPLFKMERDPRLTPIGGFLRRWSLDELPQLVNVLRGDMTLIGPRALSPLPSRYERWQLRRFELTPGIACTWQAERRGETDFEDWMRTDLEYVERGSTLLGDLKLLASTALSVLSRSGSR